MDEIWKVRAREAELIRALTQQPICDSVADAARVLPLVGWDLDLACDYLAEEISALDEEARS